MVQGPDELTLEKWTARGRPLTVGVLASHEGSVLQSVLDACASGRVSARVAVVISNNGGSGALRHALASGVRAVHLSSRTHPDPAALDVYEAVLEAGESETGASVHVVEAEYDGGPVLGQCRCPVLPGDSVEALKARVQQRERKLVANTLAALARGEVLLPISQRTHPKEEA